MRWHRWLSLDIPLEPGMTSDVVRKAAAVLMVAIDGRNLT
jgi:hypothetical protein